MTMYELHYPNPADKSRYRCHICQTITSAEQLKGLLPRRHKKNAERLHAGIIAQLQAGRVCSTIQHSPLWEAVPVREAA